MKKILFLFFSLFLSLCAQAQEVPAPTMASAAEMYFSGSPVEALQQYIQISKETKQKDAFLNAAYIELEQGHPKQAVDIMSTAYLLYPADPEVTEFVAEAYLADGQYENAEKFFSLLEGGGERSEFLLIHLARAQLGMGETELAKHNLQRAAAGNNHTALSNFLLGQIYEKEANWSQAATTYEKAVNYDHQFTEARYGWARSLEKAKNYNEAYRQYRVLRSASPKNAVYNAAITRLKPKLTKEEKELENRKERQLHTIVKPVVSLEGKLQTVRVAIGTTAGGRPAARNKVVFIPSHPFTVTLKSTGKTLAIGKAKETWRVELDKAKAVLISPKAKRYAFSGSIIIEPKSPSSSEGATIVVKKDEMSGY